MDALFNFPNGLAFTIDMIAVPKKGDLVNLAMITPDDFVDTVDYHKYQEYDYLSFSWYVSSVIWSPAGEGKSFVNIMLQRKAE